MEIDKLDINLLPGGVFCLDKEHRVLLWNAEVERITGFQAEQILHRKPDFLFLLDEKNNPIDFLNCLEELKICSHYVSLKTAYNTVKPVFIQARILQDAVYPQLHAIFMVSDITDVVCCEPDLAIREEEHHFQNLIGSDKQMKEIYKMIQLAAESMANIFISGESGTGKELIARAIHNLSDRKNGPFMIVNCSALSESLLESELFGHVKGAFTGAYKEKAGKFEAAHKGSIFLDEIGDISAAIQLKLLRVIQEKTIVRVGANEEVNVDMRIITATNKDVRQLVEDGLFREDLFYRLKVFSIHTVPLREKPGDIPLLCMHFIHHFNRKTGKMVKDLSNDAYRIVMEYCWPGNVRELENAIEHAFVLCENDYIDVFDLPLELRSYSLLEKFCKKLPERKISAEQPGRDLSREDLITILNSHNWNRTRTAEYLGISRVSLWKKLKKFGIVSKITATEK